MICRHINRPSLPDYPEQYRDCRVLTVSVIEPQQVYGSIQDGHGEQTSLPPAYSAVVN